MDSQPPTLGKADAHKRALKARQDRPNRRRKATVTSAFGASRRENHDSSDFYSRFTSPVVLNGELPRQPRARDRLYQADARRMFQVNNDSVALVVTSPPYFAGKEYEANLGEGVVPKDYLDYLKLLHDVFEQCVRKLEPGGRIAINVANLGRKPFRSLASDVTRILQDDLGLLLRGEIIWQKAAGATGSCAWGSFAKASNPVLRDLTERIIVASKGRFDRAVSRAQRAEVGLPSESTMSSEEFMQWTLDVWNIPPESAKRVGHPAPFPIELPRRLIELLTYRGDLVLDPFMGSGTTAVAAIRTGRHYLGFETDDSYVELARTRIEAERAELDSAAT